jgi:hypothetical protein
VSEPTELKIWCDQAESPLTPFMARLNVSYGRVLKLVVFERRATGKDVAKGLRAMADSIEALETETQTVTRIRASASGERLSAFTDSQVIAAFSEYCDDWCAGNWQAASVDEFVAWATTAPIARKQP